MIYPKIPNEDQDLHIEYLETLPLPRIHVCLHRSLNQALSHDQVIVFWISQRLAFMEIINGFTNYILIFFCNF